MSGSSAAGAAAAVTADDVQRYLSQTLDAYQEACRKGFTEHKFDPVTAGLTIGNHIMTNLINTSITSTQPGQKTTMENSDQFTMVSVLAKTNIAVLT